MDERRREHEANNHHHGSRLGFLLRRVTKEMNEKKISVLSDIAIQTLALT